MSIRLLVTVLCSACSLASLPDSDVPRTCPATPPLVDLGVGIGGAITSGLLARDDGALAVGAGVASFVVFGSAIYGAASHSTCREERKRRDALYERDRLLVQRRREAWRLTFAATSRNDCNVVVATAPRVRALDPEFHKAVFVPAARECIHAHEVAAAACRDQQTSALSNAIALASRVDRATALAALSSCPTSEGLTLAIDAARAAAADQCEKHVELAMRLRATDRALHDLLIRDPDATSCIEKERAACAKRRAAALAAANQITSAEKRLATLRALPRCEDASP